MLTSNHLCCFTASAQEACVTVEWYHGLVVVALRWYHGWVILAVEPSELLMACMFNSNGLCCLTASAQASVAVEGKEVVLVAAVLNTRCSDVPVCQPVTICVV